MKLNILIFTLGVIRLGIVIFNNIVQATFYITENYYFIFYVLISIIFALFYTLLIKIESRNKTITA